MNNIYVLTGNGNNNFDADDNVVLLTERDFVLVECTFNEASALAREWGLEKPMLAKSVLLTNNNQPAGGIVPGRGY